MADKYMHNSQITYGYKITEYMEKAFKKAYLHQVCPVGVVERRYEILCKDKGRMGGRREKHIQECVLSNDGCVCSCQKPRLYHLPCTHVITACLEAGGLQPRMFASHYYMKETIWNTWQREIYGFRILGDFITDPGHNATYIPDPDPEMIQGIGRRKKKRIRNNMDRSEAGPAVRICSKCHETGHNYKKCTALTYGASGSAPGPSTQTATNEAGPSASGPGPSTQTASRRGRRVTNDGLM